MKLLANLAAGPSAASTKLLSISVTLVVLAGILINLLWPSADPHRCDALLNRGHWLNRKNVDGSRLPLNKWQPDGCMMHNYTSEDVQECMEGRHMTFIGDSTTRQVFFAVGRILDREAAREARHKMSPNDRHKDREGTFAGIDLRFRWNPYLQLDAEHNTTRAEIDAFRQQREDPKPIDQQVSPALMFIGVGPWYPSYGDNEAQKGGPEATLNPYRETFENLTRSLPRPDFDPLMTHPITDQDGKGNQVFVAPPIPPSYSEGNRRLENGRGIPAEKIQVLQDYLSEHEGDFNIPVVRAIPGLLKGELAAIVDRHETGFHVIDAVAEVKAQIILNARCNAKLDRARGYPYARTCCSDYGGPLPLGQLIAIGACGAFVVLCLLNELWTMRSAEATKPQVFNMRIGIFVTALLACYWADRTHALAKGMKEYVTWEFFLLMMVPLASIWYSVVESTPPKPRPGETASPMALTDMKPLSRDQTDEWKGWMQAIILIYHWTGASSVLGIYVGVRLLVAAYLFQTGFGHAVYFSTKKDFSFKRVASVLLRLNLLSCALPYVMHTDYMFYYFAPLVTFWFLVTYATFAIGSKYNDDSRALLAKLAVSAIICPGLLIWTPVMDVVFWVLRVVFQIQWNLGEWQFRLGLDGFIVYVGILCGLASVRTKAWNYVIAGTNGTIAGIGLFLSVAYYALALNFAEDKTAYNAWHPFVSFVPILAFIALRNMNATARLRYSKSMAWLGRCSLETFTLQFHIFLAADTKGLLLLDIFGGGNGGLLWSRFLDLLVIVPCFFWISSRVADATNGLVKLITTEPGQESYQSLNNDINLDEENKGDLGSAERPSALARMLGDLRVRCAMILVAMWIMNWIY